MKIRIASHAGDVSPRYVHLVMHNGGPAEEMHAVLNQHEVTELITTLLEAQHNGVDAFDTELDV